MRYTVQYSSLLDPKSLKRIAKADRLAIKEAIEQKLTTSPETFGKPLRFSLKGHRSLRVGDHRVIFRIDGSIVRVLLIAHRSAVYSRVTEKLPGKRAA